MSTESVNKFRHAPVFLFGCRAALSNSAHAALAWVSNFRMHSRVCTPPSPPPGVAEKGAPPRASPPRPILCSRLRVPEKNNEGAENRRSAKTFAHTESKNAAWNPSPIRLIQFMSCAFLNLLQDLNEPMQHVRVIVQRCQVKPDTLADVHGAHLRAIVIRQVKYQLPVLRVVSDDVF